MFGLSRKINATRKEIMRLILRLAHLTPDSSHKQKSVCQYGGLAKTGISGFSWISHIGRGKEISAKLFLTFAEVCHLQLQCRSGDMTVPLVGEQSSLSRTGCGSRPASPRVSAVGNPSRGVKWGSWADVAQGPPARWGRLRGGTASTSRGCFTSYPIQTIFCVPPPDVHF